MKPTVSSSCPVSACLTWNQYSSQPGQQYFKTGVTFLFLPGNHQASFPLTLTKLSHIQFRGLNDSFQEVNISITKSAVIIGKSINNFTVHGLTFNLKSNNTNTNISALRFENSPSVFIKNCTFRTHKLSTGFSKALHSSNSSIECKSCMFVGNTGDIGSGVYATSISYITVIDSIFMLNHASNKGGAIYLLQISLQLTGSLGYSFVNNSAGKSGGAIQCEHGIVISTAFTEVAHSLNFQTKFSHNKSNKGGGLYALNSMVRIGMNDFDTHTFSSNAAEDGGAVYFLSSRLRLRLLSLAGTNDFSCNSVSSYKSAGGAIYVKFGNLTLSGIATFSNNKAYYGGAVYIFGTDTILGGNTTHFENNEAEFGGAIFIVTSFIVTTAKSLDFVRNKAYQKGGALRISNFATNYEIKITGNYFNNSASTCGSAVYIETGYNISLIGINISNNSGSGLCSYKGRISFKGNSFLTNNQASSSGGIRSEDSLLKFYDKVIISGNNATLGGAIFSFSGSYLQLYGEVFFEGNMAAETGGAVFAFDSNITVIGIANFTSNFAQRGGALYINSATLNLFQLPSTVFATALNHATEFGGAIYYEDSVLPSQCNLVSKNYQYVDQTSDLPLCFVQIQSVIWYAPGMYVVPATISSHLDSSGYGGDFIYGGLLDRCRMTMHNVSNDSQNSILPYKFLVDRAIKVKGDANSTTNIISSRAYQMCFCETNEIYDCSASVLKLEVHRGQTFRVPLLALNQIRVVTSTTVTAKVSASSSVRYYQNSQALPNICSNLTYNVYSRKSIEELVLYPDGPCRDTGIVRGIVQVKLLPCPDGFSLMDDRCICEERLQIFNAVCVIDEDWYITRSADSTFWMSALYENGTYQGLILYKTCPIEYCTDRSVNITLPETDVQCSSNRVGKLCGKCRGNFSLILGGTKCEKCSNVYLFLLIPFAGAGVVLVCFLTLTRLTVATGMINSIILYANIIHANKYLFGTENYTSFLTVFIAWLNLDLGFNTCFFDGLDAYIQTWLQFAFPIYIWCLICLIIISSKHSIIISKLIGSNPIAVLATLLLMSYTKFLKIIIDVFSFVELDYPGYTARVWLKDANVPFMQSKHLILAIITAMVCVCFFLPYTFLLLLGPKLYTFEGGKHYVIVLKKLKPLLDSYYAPYKKDTRYWTGFILLIRCVSFT